MDGWMDSNASGCGFNVQGDAVGLGCQGEWIKGLEGTEDNSGLIVYRGFVYSCVYHELWT